MIFIRKITDDTDRICQSCLEPANYYLYVQSRSSNIRISVCTECVTELELNISCNLEPESKTKEIKK